jgi:hypothetical protein
MGVVFVNSGACFQIECHEGPRFRAYFDVALRPEDLSAEALDGHDVLIIPCHTPVHRILAKQQVLLDFLELGGTLFASGRSKNEQWLPNVSFDPCPTNFWWWLTPGETLGTEIAKPEHSLFQYIDHKAITWHLHGFYNVPEGAEVLATGPDNRPILYIDDVTTNGRMIITSLDPFSHHGRHFMPSATRFLDGLLPWLRTSDAVRAR